MFNLFKKNKETWKNPVKGEIIPITEVPDEVFSSKMMGDGFGVKPEDDRIYSPLNGKVIKVFKTKHALLIHGDSGLEVIVHIGLGTVELKGEGFQIHVEEGQHVEAGTHIATADMAYIQSQEKSIVSPVIITNMEMVKAMDITYGTAEAGTEVCNITKA